MINKLKKYYGKALLFGEYTIIDGGDALAIPLKGVAGILKKKKFKSFSHDVLADYYKYLIDYKDLPLDFARLKNDILNGLYFESNAPKGYGVGSSGMLTAAIFDQYKKHEYTFTLVDLKLLLGKMESYFHGSSSGLDPLVSYLHQPLWIHDGEIELIDHLDNHILSGFFLVDTGRSRQTSPFVKLFKDKMISSAYRQAIEELKTEVTSCVTSIYSGEISEFHIALKKVSAIQYEYFKEMIPDFYEDLWKQGLKSDRFYFKLCGAGGGGYLFLYQMDHDFSLPVDIIPLNPTHI